MRHFLLPLVLLGMSSLSVRAGEMVVDPDVKGYSQTVVPFFAKYCQECHDGEKPEGEFAIDAKRLLNDFGDPGARGKWREIVNVLNSHEMPPEKEIGRAHV